MCDEFSSEYKQWKNKEHEIQMLEPFKKHHINRKSLRRSSETATKTSANPPLSQGKKINLGMAVVKPHTPVLVLKTRTYTHSASMSQSSTRHAWTHAHTHTSERERERWREGEEATPEEQSEDTMSNSPNLQTSTRHPATR